MFQYPVMIKSIERLYNSYAISEKFLKQHSYLILSYVHHNLSSQRTIMISSQSPNNPMSHQLKLYREISNKTVSFHCGKRHQVFSLFALSFHIKMNILNLTKQECRHKSSALSTLHTQCQYFSFPAINILLLKYDARENLFQDINTLISKGNNLTFVSLHMTKSLQRDRKCYYIRKFWQHKLYLSMYLI